MKINKILLAFLFFYICFPSYWSFRYELLPVLNPTRIFLFSIIIACFLNLISSEKKLFYFYNSINKLKFYFWLPFFYFLWRIIVSINSPNILFSFAGSINEIFYYFFIYIFVSVYFDGENDTKLFFKSLNILVIFICSLGLIEFTSSTNIVANYTPSWVTLESWVESSMEDKVRDGYRVQSKFTHPLVLAQFLLFSVPFIWYSICRSKNIKKLIYALILSIMIFLIYETQSRIGLGVLLFWATTELFYRLVYIGSNKKIGLSIIFILFTIFFIYGSDLVLKKIDDSTAEESSSALARVVQLQKSIVILSEHPIGGLGLKMAPEYVGHDTATGGKSIDSYFLSIIVETGIVGLFLSFLLLFIFIFPFEKKYISNNKKSKEYLHTIMMAAINFIIVSLILSITEIYSILFFALGIYASIVSKLRHTEVKSFVIVNQKSFL